MIKFEGSFKSGNSDCFVLEHVEHEQPELHIEQGTVLELVSFSLSVIKGIAGQTQLKNKLRRNKLRT
ncbi:unnamed protein product [Trifolium pratense]|uniref:Uncharacterized protein n=1 Tax=Trifolium pratense TaxID=57577 RepID=A0ACB0M0A7_TRIPR|nr:unnamed protein product [Trifolium pratense]